MLTVHHLGHSQSERIVWLCEELGIPYELRHYRRDAVTRLSPPELRALHPLGAAPLIEDGDLLLANRPLSSSTSSPDMATAASGSTPRTQITRPTSIGFISRTAICNP
jgi:hypothetical protein